MRRKKVMLASKYNGGPWPDYMTRLFRPADPSSLAVFRICYGLLMMLDVPYERELHLADKKWGNPAVCHFPLIPSFSPLPYNWMCIVYLVMWLGSVGIMLGYRFYSSCLAFLIPYWYLMILEKTDWNNHSYMFGLMAVLLWCTNANSCWSIDGIRMKTKKNDVPFWNYFILRFQVFILYFMAGLKKANYDWLHGYSMKGLSNHWVFDPLKILLTNRQIELWIIHIGGFLIDASAGFGLHFNKTRPITLTILFFFHFMNSRMFYIGMFPYVGIATMFIFCEPNWPKNIIQYLSFLKYNQPSEPNSEGKPIEISCFRKYLTVSLLVFHIIMQLFLPFSHFITKGYNGWTNGQYGYSWDMMVNRWDVSMVVIAVVDNDTGSTFYLNADDWVLNDKWYKRADTVKQFAMCAQRNFHQEMQHMHNISLYIDVWCSLNGRVQQRMFDPGTDIITAEWSAFEEVSWSLPLLTEFSDWREKLDTIAEEKYQSSNYTSVIFLADFPGFHLDNHVDEGQMNVTLTVLKGKVQIVEENSSNILDEGETTPIRSNSFHQVHSVLNTPSCYMYTYINKILFDRKNDTENSHPNSAVTDVRHYINKVIRSIYFISNAVLDIAVDYLLTL